MPFYQNFKDFGSIGKLESQDENIIGAPKMIMRDKRLSIFGFLAMIAIFKAIALPTTAIAIKSDNYCCRNNSNRDKYKGSNRENKKRSNLQNRYKR